MSDSGLIAGNKQKQHELKRKPIPLYRRIPEKVSKNKQVPLPSQIVKKQSNNQIPTITLQNLNFAIISFAAEMEFIRTNRAIQFIWIITSLIIFNCSIGGPEPESQRKGGIYERNIAESLVVIIMDQIVSFENSISKGENQETDNTKNISLKEANDFPYLPLVFIISFKLQKPPVNKGVIYKETYTEQFHPELLPPPPKV